MRTPLCYCGHEHAQHSLGMARSVGACLVCPIGACVKFKALYGGVRDDIEVNIPPWHDAPSAPATSSQPTGPA